VNGQASVFVLTRDSPIRKALVRLIEADGRTVSAVETASALSRALDGHPANVLVVDLAAGADALRAVRALQGRKPRVPIVAVADPSRPDAGAEVLHMGALDIIARPVRPADLHAALANAREFQGVAFRLSELDVLEQDDGFFAASAPMRAVRDLVRQVAPSRCGVLLVGERGTGKEMVARAIHRLSRAAERPFVSINCAYRGESPQADREAVADFEREVFQAVARPSLDLPAADRPDPDAVSTVFLRGLDHMAPVVQATLERLLVESESQVGPDRLLPVRLLAAARPSIHEAVERGTFRRDLFERLAVVRIELPPLRRRPQDVPLLAMHFLKDACRRHDAPPKVFSPSAQTLLTALPWRGNARELQQLAERLAVLVTRGVVLQEDVLEHVLLEGTSPRGVPGGTLREARERFEREFIAGVLQRHRGRMGAAAQELGIERTNLYRKIKQLGIKWQ
jgi:DNA-binding NtrC family response regulator